MLLKITKAEYVGDYRLKVTFNTGEIRVVDMESTVMNDQRAIFQSLRDKAFFKRFTVDFNTVVWENQLDIAPEYLYEKGVAVNKAA